MSFGSVTFSSLELRVPGDRAVGSATMGCRWSLIVVRLHPDDFFGDTSRTRATRSWLDQLVTRLDAGGRLRVDCEYVFTPRSS